jgi:hypothetical protein
MSTNLEIVELLIQLSEVSINESVTLFGNLNLFAGVFDYFAVLLFDLKKKFNYKLKFKVQEYNTESIFITAKL